MKIKPVAALLWLAMSGTTQAALHDRGSGLIYDDVLNVTWLQDANYAMTSGYDADGLMTWDVANTWANNLVFSGYDDWRLPTTPFLDSTCSDTTGAAKGYGCTGSEMGHLFYNELGGEALSSITAKHTSNYLLFSNIQSGIYWYATESPPPQNVDQAWFFFFSTGDQDESYKDLDFYAWAVRDGDVAAVPEPETYAMFLVGLGLVSAATRWRRG